VLFFELKLHYGSKGARMEHNSFNVSSDIPDEEFTSGTAGRANVRYFETGRLTSAPIITHRFPLREADQAYRYLG
jgi:threonine dehydrogenase-like Zn-dependent dehydrogenase